MDKRDTRCCTERKPSKLFCHLRSVMVDSVFTSLIILVFCVPNGQTLIDFVLCCQFCKSQATLISSIINVYGSTNRQTLTCVCNAALKWWWASDTSEKGFQRGHWMDCVLCAFKETSKVSLPPLPAVSFTNLPSVKKRGIINGVQREHHQHRRTLNSESGRQALGQDWQGPQPTDRPTNQAINQANKSKSEP